MRRCDAMETRSHTRSDRVQVVGVGGGSRSANGSSSLLPDVGGCALLCGGEEATNSLARDGDVERDDIRVTNRMQSGVLACCLAAMRAAIQGEGSSAKRSVVQVVAAEAAQVAIVASMRR